MVLQKFKSLKDARKAMMNDLIAESVNKSHEVKTEEQFPHFSPYKRGLYRFKSWEEARRFDMESIIRHSCK